MFDRATLRADLRAYWPRLSHFYGLRPWDVDELSDGEVEAYLADLAKREA